MEGKKYMARDTNMPVSKSAVRDSFQFICRVLGDFRANQGLLLAGAVAYYALLSIIPFFTLILVAFSNVVPEAELLRILDGHLKLLIPGLEDTLLAHAATFLEYRHAVGWIGILLMLFFSSIAFTVLESTIALIFHHRAPSKRRHFAVSAIIPYFYIMLVALCLPSSHGLQRHSPFQRPPNRHLPLEHQPRHLRRNRASFRQSTGMVLLLSSLYMIMPRSRIAARNALIGGVAATLLWEIVRRVMVWYFQSLSMVNVIYGSLAAVVVALLSLEAAGIILLLGAQLVAELEESRKKALDKTK